jgi:CRISPR/Cas system-associated exonuclease Cas4 (RecB family)
MRPWSYSRLSTYETCPKQYWYAYVENMEGFRPEPVAANRGKVIHKEGEDYLLGKKHIYPASYQKVSSHIMGLKSKHAIPEIKMACDDKWVAVDWNAPEAYFRGIIDVHYEADEGKTVHIEDFKTGQIYPEHSGQMEDYVALAASHYPEADKFETRLIYVDQGIVTPAKVTEKVRLKPIRLMLDGRINIAEEDTIFPTTSGKHCQWCDYSRKYGGPCPNG